MKLFKTIFPYLFLISIVLIFFYKIFLGLLPFPSDLLVSEYNPWKTYSYLGYNPGSYPNKAQYFDVLRQIYPWKTFSINSLKSKEIPLWNPYNFSGGPLLANFQSAVFYPFNMIYLFFPQIFSWSILVVLQPLLTTLFTYAYAKKIGISKTGSIFAAISFTFSSFLSVWIEYNTIVHVIIWLPLLLLSIENLLEKKTYFWMGSFILSLVFSLFAGHPQIFLYLLIFITVYLLYRASNLKKSPKIIFLLIITALGIGAIQIIPGLELIANAARSNHDYNFLIEKILIQPWQLVMFFVPDFFGNPATRNYWIQDTYIGKVTSVGIVTVFFILLAITRRKNIFIKFFLFTCIFILLFSTSNPFTQIAYRFDIPFFSSSAPTLSIFILCFSLAILSGRGIDIWQKESLSKRNFFLLVFMPTVIFIILWLCVFLIPKANLYSWAEKLLLVSSRTLLYTTGIFLLSVFLIWISFVKNKTKFFVIVLLLLLHTFDLFRSFHKFNPFSPISLTFPETSIINFLQKKTGIDRFWGYGNAALDANFTTQYSIFSPDGYDPLYPKQYGSFLQSSKNGVIETTFTNQTRSDAVLAPGYAENFPDNKFRLKVLNLLGIKYILDRVDSGSTEKTFPENKFKLLYEENGWRVFENINAAPRIFFAEDYKVFSSKEEFEKIFFSNDFNPSKTVLLEKNIGKIKINQDKGRIYIKSYKPNSILLSVEASSDRILFLSDVYYPGWKAYVDGKDTEIYRANYAFRSILVPKGKHEVVFTFEPASFKIGIAVSGISLIACVFLLAAFGKKIKYE